MTSNLDNRHHHHHYIFFIMYETKLHKFNVPFQQQNDDGLNCLNFNFNLEKKVYFVKCQMANNNIDITLCGKNFRYVRYAKKHHDDDDDE